VIKVLKKEGWEVARISGSPHVLVKGEKVISVPVHGSRDLKTGTLKSIEKDSGVKLT
jgi:predicted RNA binding protein YcfA (HicA-like mRNA interferase family)